MERRAKKETNVEEIKKLKNEKRRLYRLKKKEEKNESKAGGVSINHSLNLANGLKNSLQKTLNFHGNIPIIPVISDEIQNKIFEESKKLQSSLLIKLHPNLLSVKNVGQNKILTNFFKESQSKQNNSLIREMDTIDLLDDENETENINKVNNIKGSIDLTLDDSLHRDFNRNKIPTEEEAKKILTSITRSGMIDLAAMNKLALTNPILYAKVNNLYISSLNSSLPKSAAVVKKLNIKYPIEDEELYNNPEMYNLNKEFFNKPRGKATTVPTEYFTKILKISDFINTFKHKLEISEILPEDLYSALIYFNEEDLHIINELHIAVLQVIIENLKETEYESLHEDGETDLMLLKLGMMSNNSQKRELLKNTWPEVMRLLINSDLYKSMVTEDLKDLSRRLKFVNTRNYNLLSLEEKLMLIDYLLNTAMDSDLIKKTIEEDIKMRIELTREKNDIEAELKQFESRKKEIERQEKFTSSRQKIESLNKRLQTLVEDNPQLSRVELTKLRRECEQEREKFKSITKEAEEIECNRNKINTRLEKISNEIFYIPTINKKLLGRDGLKNEYYFYPWINNKLYIKQFLKDNIPNKDCEIVRTKKFEWREITTDDEINELLTKLSEKGIRETDLLNKLKKLSPKRLKLKVTTPTNTNSANKNDIMLNNDNGENSDKTGMLVDKEAEAALDTKSAINWRNKVHEKPNRVFKQNIQVHTASRSQTGNTSSECFDEVIKSFKSIEEKISDYLNQDEKEWEAFDVRQSWKAWLEYIRKVPEYAKSLLLFNEKFKTPYKINEFKSKIIEDDYDYAQVSIINPDGSLDIYNSNPNRTIASKVKLWSKELENLEEFFVEYVNNILSLSSLSLGIQIFDGILNDLFRRRDYYKKKEGGLASIIDDADSFGDHPHNGNLKSHSNNNKRNKIDFNEYNYDENYHKDISINIFSEETRRSRRLQKNKSVSNNNFPNLINKKKKEFVRNFNFIQIGMVRRLLHLRG